MGGPPRLCSVNTPHSIKEATTIQQAANPTISATPITALPAVSVPRATPLGKGQRSISEGRDRAG